MFPLLSWRVNIRQHLLRLPGIIVKYNGIAVEDRLFIITMRAKIAEF